jgi:putative hydrolase of the HAD superfamily
MPFQIKAVLLDSGDTLVKPIGGAWWPRPGFIRLLNDLGVHVDPEKLGASLDSGMRFLDTHHLVRNEAEEVAQFEEYYRIVLSNLDIEMPQGVVEKLARDEVYLLGQEPFPDTRAVLQELRAAGLRLGIVSNAWPSLERVYRELHLRDFFEAFVISSKIGCLKPDARIYTTALRQLGREPGETLFVDDDADYMRAAEALGMRGVVMSRYRTAPVTANTITTLAELRSFLEPRTRDP